MARIRSLKPETAADKKLASFPIQVRYTFLLVLSRADDYGLLEAEPRQLVGDLYPHDADVTEEILQVWLEVLVQSKLLRWRNTRDGARVLEVVNWSRHQVIPRPGKPLLRDRLAPIDWNSPAQSEVDVRAVARTFPATDKKKLCAERDREVGKGSGKGNDAPVGAWPGEAFELYKAAVGIVPIPRLAKALKPAVDTYGWETVKPWFAAYCRSRPYQKRDGSIHGDDPRDDPTKAVRDTRFMSPEEFVKTIAIWRDRCAPLVKS